MKRLILGLAAMFAVSMTSFAQNAAPAQTPATEKAHAGGVHQKDHAAAGQAAHKGGGGILKDLNLTPEQETQFKEANQKHQTAVQAVNKDKAIAQTAKAAKIAELKTQYEAAVKAIFNEEQYTKWLEKRNAPKAKKGKGKK
jgi:Spy/CpxP family protein refolding chaperone